MKTFIDDSSVLKKIWGARDITLFIFAGASAEFALNKQVDWLYFTGKLPADPIGRLFSTVRYAQLILFSEEPESVKAIEKINTIHRHVETAREKRIPEAAYKDVLYMLIHYSIVSFELLERPLTAQEKEDIVRAFSRIGQKMHLHNTPATYSEWKAVYSRHLRQNLVFSSYTRDLFKQYRKRLGAFRYQILLEVQQMLVPAEVRELLPQGKPVVADKLVSLYRPIRRTRIGKWLVNALMPRHRGHLPPFPIRQKSNAQNGMETNN